MTDFRSFLAALYDSVSEAEIEALMRGQDRLKTLLDAEAIPRDTAMPVYHASDVEVTLAVRLETERRKDGLHVVMRDAEPDDPSAVAITLDLFDLIDRFDLSDGVSDEDGDGNEGNGPGKGDPHAQPVDLVHGIGSAYTERLKAHGIETLGELVALSSEELAEMVSGEQIDISPERTGSWIEEARGLLSVLSELEGEQPVELVDGIGPTFGRRLREHEIEHLSDLVEQDPASVAEIVSTEEVTISPQQAAGWLKQGELVLRTLADIEARASDDADEVREDGGPHRVHRGSIDEIGDAGAVPGGIERDVDSVDRGIDTSDVGSSDRGGKGTAVNEDHERDSNRFAYRIDDEAEEEAPADEPDRKQSMERSSKTEDDES